MAKVLEGPGMGLLKKWGMAVPHYRVISSLEELEAAMGSEAWLKNTRLVVKAHEAVGSRMKQGLVKVDLDIEKAKRAAGEMLGRVLDSGMKISEIIISEMVPHEKEFYIAVQSTREGSDLLLASFGGIEIEENWEKVKKLSLQVGDVPETKDIEKLAREAGFPKDLIASVTEFAVKLFKCFDTEDAQYLEINPLVLNGEGALVALDAVTLLDGDARFRHPDWDFSFAAEFGRAYSDSENEVMSVDSKIKGSVKFIEIPGGDTALLPAGGGASVFYTDAVVALGGKPANYAEYSGDPADWAVEVLTEKVCNLKGIKNIIVGGAIANFTNVKKTFGGIIAGFRKAKSEGKLEGVKIWVRRGGPFEKEGLELMKSLEKEGFAIQVFDRYTPLTDIVDMALGKDNKGGSDGSNRSKSASAPSMAKGQEAKK